MMSISMYVVWGVTFLLCLICIYLFLIMEKHKNKPKPILESELDDKPHYETLIEGKLYYLPHHFRQDDLPTNYELFLKENPHLEVISVEKRIDEQPYMTGVLGYYIFTK